eukprot:1517827-Pleurochrysis_carterae.AAC.2
MSDVARAAAALNTAGIVARRARSPRPWSLHAPTAESTSRSPSPSATLPTTASETLSASSARDDADTVSCNSARRACGPPTLLLALQSIAPTRRRVTLQGSASAALPAIALASPACDDLKSSFAAELASLDCNGS